MPSPTNGEASLLLPTHNTLRPRFAYPSQHRRQHILSAAVILSAVCVISMIAVASSPAFYDENERVELRGAGATESHLKNELDDVFRLISAEQSEDKATGADTPATLLRDVASSAQSDVKDDVDTEKADADKVEEEETSIQGLMKSARLATRELIMGENEAKTEQAKLEAVENLPLPAISPQNSMRKSNGGRGGIKQARKSVLDDATASAGGAAAAAPAAPAASAASAASAAPVVVASGSGAAAVSGSGDAAVASAGSAAVASASGAVASGASISTDSSAPTASSTASGSSSSSESSGTHEHHSNSHEEDWDDNSGPPLFLFHGMWIVVFVLCMIVGALLAVQATRGM